jgi:hypothetical protein
VREYRFVDEVSRTIRDAQKDEAVAFSSSRPNHELHNATRSNPSIPTNLNLSAFEDNLYVSFLLSNLCLGVILPTSLMQMHAEDTTSLLSQLSIRALSTAYFGRIHRQEDVMNRGALMYGNALRHLIEDLEDCEKACSLSILSSVITLQTYEVS